MELVRAATYDRRIPTAAERVWENVRDWEHLPWLHRSSFSSIALLDEGAWGWAARIGLQPGEDGARGGEIVVELRIDATASRYVARTVEGALQGAEVWTEVRERSPSATDVAVEFLVPQTDPAVVSQMGAGYLALYRQLWDEDESMMVRRAAELGALGSTPPQQERLRLGTPEALRQRDAPVVTWRGRPFRIREHEGTWIAHAARCPHLFGPLDRAPIEDGCVVCPWHGYRFDLRTGQAAEGRPYRLPSAPRVRTGEDGALWLEPAGSRRLTRCAPGDAGRRR